MAIPLVSTGLLTISYVGFNTASGVSLTATASPGTTVVSQGVTVGLNTMNVIVVWKIFNLYGIA